MKIHIKVAIAFFALFFGVVALMEYFTQHKKAEVFQLIDQVEESDLAFHANITKLFLEIEKYSNETKVELTSRILTNQVKQQLLKSGLRLDETYITYSLYSNQTGSFYAEIGDTSIFKAAFERFSGYFDMESSSEYPFLYQSNSVDLSIEKYPKYVKINWGKNVNKIMAESSLKSSPLFKSLLLSANQGIINTTGTPTLDSVDYAIFTYNYDDHFSFTIDWKVAKNHPLQPKQKSLPIYGSQKNKVQGYTNIDIAQLKRHINPFLKQKSIFYFEKLPSAVNEILTKWNGEASIQMGGKITTETIQLVTEFDDDFNQVERKIIKTDSLPDLGIYWGTKDAKSSYDLLKDIPNVQLKKNQLQLALFPPLNIMMEKESLKATSTEAKFNKEKSKFILLIHSDNDLLNGHFTIEKTTQNNVQLKFVLKDLKTPEKFNISSIW